MLLKKQPHVLHLRYNRSILGEQKIQSRLELAGEGGEGAGLTCRFLKIRKNAFLGISRKTPKFFPVGHFFRVL